MDAAGFLRSQEWHKMGRWKNPLLVVSVMTPQILGGEGTAIPFAPSSYVIVNYAQYVPSKDYAQNVQGATQMFEKDFTGTVRALVRQVEQSTKKMQEWLPREFSEQFAEQIAFYTGRHARNWYEIMLADGALSTIFPKTLPESLSLGGQTLTRASILTKCALPKRLFPTGAEKISLLKVACQLEGGGEASKELSEHARNFGWLSAICWWDEPYAVEHYRARALELSRQEPQKMLDEFEQKRQQQYEQGERLLELVRAKYPDAFECLEAIRTLADLKEENWDVVSAKNPVVRPVFRKVAVEQSLSVPQLLQMTYKEFLLLVQSGQMPGGVDADELNIRVKSHAFFNKQGEKEFFVSGKQAEQLGQLLEKGAPAGSELKGTPIWAGMVRARVRVLSSVDQISSMKQGEVLVCPMSDPDYLPAINKASAIVADQGGLLCHAAIVARELQIPCVVGTEYATKLLKDGDEVEVDAVQGIVRKI